MVFSDPFEAAVTKGLHSKAAALARTSAREELHACLREVADNFADGRELSGAAATDVVATCIRHVSTLVLKWAENHSPFQWLWLLRRVHDESFAGTISTSAQYARNLAEVASGMSSCLNPPALIGSSGLIVYPVEPTTIVTLGRLIEGANMLRGLHATYRWSAKNASVTISGAGCPAAAPEPDLRAAVEDYDKRVLADSPIFGRTGTTIFDTMPSPNSPDSLAVVGRVAATKTPGHVYPITSCSLAPLRELFRRAERNDVVEGDAQELASLVRCLNTLFIFPAAARSRVTSHGYLSCHRDLFLEALHRLGREEFFVNGIGSLWGQVEPEEVLENLKSAQGQLHPLLPGPLIRQEGALLLVDYAAATWRLGTSLQYIRDTGEIGVARGKHFEDVVQQVIDQSPWKPSAQLRQCRKTLKINKRHITDLDAVGEQGANCLLVSCKSNVYSAKYDAGDCNTVRNVEDRLLEALHHWETVVHVQKGDNFDLTGYQNLIGIVCTPQVMYVLDGSAREDALPGLRRCCSINELRRWLAPSQA